MTSQQEDEYQYLFEKGFMEVTKEDKKEGNHWIRPTKKFFDALAEQVVLLSKQLPREDPDVVLAYAAKKVIEDSDKSLPEEITTNFGCYLYTFLKDSNIHKGCLEIVNEHQQYAKIKKIANP